MYSLGVLAFTSFLLALVLTPLWRNLCRRWGWVDRPDGGRRLHRVPVPRVGGVPIFAAYLGALAVVVLSPLAGGDLRPGRLADGLAHLARGGLGIRRRAGR
jgi:UDP-N-acetylmuramyl pentapeptide phosphotransferase/UDP-N-acetylglucosamine-1-phosphate transferase